MQDQHDPHNEQCPVNEPSHPWPDCTCPKARGLWIVFEGPDGAGKTTTMEAVAKRLRALEPGLEVIETRHPGATPLGQHIRKLVKTPSFFDVSIKLDPLSEQMLLAVDHVNFKSTILEPALERGAVVLADRCNLISGLVYGVASGLRVSKMNAIFDLMVHPRVDQMFVLTATDDVLSRRMESRNLPKDKFERLSGVLDAYSTLLTKSPEQIAVVNRIVSIDNVQYVVTGDHQDVAQDGIVLGITTSILRLIEVSRR